MHGLMRGLGDTLSETDLSDKPLDKKKIIG